jgi:short-subunit dehydrogenase
MTGSGTARRTALITGASAGIGTAFAHIFARHGFDLVLTARRLDRLEALAGQIRTEQHVMVHVVQEDLSDPGAPSRLQLGLGKSGVAIDALVNNAGYGVAGRYLASPWERHAAFLQVMVTSVAELTHRFLGPMVERRYGRIINVASLAGLVPATAGHTLYAPSKALLIKFSESLALEVRTHDVHVTALCPGFTHTEFHDVLGTRDLVQRQLPRWMWMDADEVARQGFDAVMAGRPVCVTGRVNRTIAFLTRHLPDSVLRWTANRQSRKYRRV